MTRTIAVLVLVLGLALAGCSARDLREAATNVRMQAENIGAAQEAARYTPVPGEGGYQPPPQKAEAETDPATAEAEAAAAAPKPPVAPIIIYSAPPPAPPPVQYFPTN
ncbi:hypothetical protein [Phenylobacterium sp.]|uniref:hypothetical protein n=1 Tax=Phenylobacterium sp. TaxID=1871053 RepID=UPI002737EE45|nr:hypothetical protein [Phenylobacterium sp.]MDP3870821.1 hypothetical protein [Phenylobacterium sp.]